MQKKINIIFNKKFSNANKTFDNKEKNIYWYNSLLNRECHSRFHPLTPMAAEVEHDSSVKQANGVGTRI